MTVVLVTGGRTYRNETRAYQILDAAVQRLGLTSVIHGDADGADALAKQWAGERGIGQRKFPADWDNLSHPEPRIRTNRFGKKYDANAGSRRNRQMLDQGHPDLVIAFPGGVGTRDMIRRARQAGVKVVLIDWEG